ncbi:MAG TPA: PAS domain S-box protein [Tepidiformaceae bacterium]|nr:PAS domain S-box protein [Tepidiformaceae bacterium]
MKPEPPDPAKLETPGGDIVPVGIFRTDPQGRCFSVNQRWSELSGRSREESLGYGYQQAIHPDDRQRVITATARALSEERPMRLEFRLQRPDGSVVWVLVSAVGWYSEDEKVAGCLGTVTDISARVRAEQALRESEERYRKLVELSPDLITIHRNGVMEYVNQAGLDMMRCASTDDVVGHHILEFVVEEHRELAIERMRELASGQAIPAVELQGRRVDGEVIWIETVAAQAMYEGEPAVQLVARDVTARREQAAAYRSVVESVRDPMWIMDRGTDGEWRVALANAAYLSGSNLPADQIVGLTLAELHERGVVDREYVETRVELYNQVAASKRVYEHETQPVWAGRQMHLQVTYTPVVDSAGNCDRVVGWSRDLTRRREHERILSESQANYRAVVEGTSDAIWVVDRTHDDRWVVAMVNARTGKMLGAPAAELVGRPLDEVLPEGAARVALSRARQAEAAGEPIEYETVIERPGYRVEVMTHLTPLFDERGGCHRIIGSWRDVSDRRRAESPLLQAQKLESMGVLAGGISHDFNNLLATILGNLYLVRQGLPDGSELLAYIDDARLAGERGADLVRKLLGFSRPGIARRERLSLNALFAETASLVRRTLSPDIELVFELPPSPDHVMGEYSGLQQVLLNLLLNAGDAMPEGGRLIIERSEQVIGNEQIWAQRGILPGRYLEVTVMDNGIGMSRDLLQRIFDPFFTTKGVGKGTGLGLSTALSIVRAHGGWLEAESVEGEGSTFRMLLPAAD